MKTGKLLISVLCTLFCFGVATAQTYYYSTTKTFNENGYVYQCDVSPASQFVTLCNASNKCIYTSPMYQDGTHYRENNNVRLIEKDNWTKAKANDIVNNAFSATEKQRIKEYEVGPSVTIYIDPNTGKVIEVDFNFTSLGAAATIPVSVYRKIELDLKNQIWFTPTAEGKKLNFIMFSWTYRVE